ncbi:MAG: sulfatase-like hydrolase/transferase [Anaerolineales bacterium]
MENEQKPNILFILTDQHKLDAMGCYRDTPCRTPNLDRLAETGVRFETAYTACPVCSPTRSTIMTGLYPHQHGMCCNVEDLGCSVHELVDRPALLTRRLQDAGYRCGYTGKWHLGSDREEFYGLENEPTLPRNVGFEGQQFPGHGGGGFEYPEYNDYLAQHGWEHEVIPQHDRPFHAWNYGMLKGPVESTVPCFLARHTNALIDRFRAAGDPFFIWHSFWGPHSPYFIPRQFYEMYRDVEIPEWPNYRWDARALNRPHQVKLHTHADDLTWDDWAEAVRYYYGFTTLIDQQIGGILRHLEKRGLRDNTIIIFAADHGETLGTHGGLTDKGWHHFEEIQRVPFIVWMPERYYGNGVRPGDALHEWISLVDLYPSILDVAGAHVEEEELPGRSIWPLFDGGSVEWRDQVFVEFFGVNSLVTTMASVRKGNFKYGWNCSSHDDLYDLGADPHEMHNLIDEPPYGAVVSEMRGLLEEWMGETAFPGLGYYRRTRMDKWPY